MTTRNGTAALDALRQAFWTPGNLDRLKDLLGRAGTFDFPALPGTGLFPAAHLSARGRYTGYQNVWVRDNVHVAHALWRAGHNGKAERAVRSLLAFIDRHRWRIEAILSGLANPDDPMQRPHVRFDGATLNELDETWSHAQNDALGYLLWLACRMIGEQLWRPSDAERSVLNLLPPYFECIRYWQDRDSGHWEEERKVEASSIGVVVAGLDEYRSLGVGGTWEAVGSVAGERLDALIRAGREALGQILPYECVESGRERYFDSALLFLIHPLDVVATPIADVIVRNVDRFLKGPYGIRRYLLDSFWCADYDLKADESLRTADVSQDIGWRDALVELGEEAQWCVFDPILSVIHGRRYASTGDDGARRLQVQHFNRSLAQLTGPDSGFPELRCPELYYRRRGQYVPNDATPLLWTQANLLLAFETMKATTTAV